MLERKTIEELEELSPQELGEILLEMVYEYVNIEYLKVLIDHGAYLGARDNSGLTPLHSAAYYGRLEMVKVLISTGVDLEAKDDNDYRAVHFAVMNHHINIIQVLLKAGASKDAKTNASETPWDIAPSRIKEQVPELNPNA